MAEIAETRRLPATVINGQEFPSLVVLPASALEYFSRELTCRICDRWREIDDPLLFTGIHTWLMGVRATLSAVNIDDGFEYGPSCWIRAAIDDLDTLVLLSYARKWNQTA